MKNLVLSSLSCFFAIAPAFAQDGNGPFGISMGQSVTSLKVVKRLEKNSFEVQVPRPNSEFESYTVKATPTDGVCKVLAIGKTHTNDDSGYDTRSAFSHLRDTLNGKYGNNKDYDFLHSGSIWKVSNDFKMAVLKKERTLASFWDTETGATLPSTVQSIMLDTSAVYSGPYVTLSYEFKNFAKCKARDDVVDDAAL